MNKKQFLEILFLFITSLIICKCIFTYIEPHAYINIQGESTDYADNSHLCEASTSNFLIGCHIHGTNIERGDIGDYNVNTLNGNCIGGSRDGQNISEGDCIEGGGTWTRGTARAQRGHNSDCQGNWSGCNSNCERTYQVTSPQSGGGRQCPSSDTAPPCAENEDDCPPNINCWGFWSDCDINCSRQWTTLVEQSGRGIGCPSEHPPCNPGDGMCPSTNSDCQGSWSDCTSTCERIFTQTQEQQGNGQECPISPPCNPGDDQCPLQIDCVLESESDARARCPAECGPVTQTVTTEASGGGAECGSRTSYDCGPGDGACIPTTPCVLESESDARARCDTACGNIIQRIITPASGPNPPACNQATYECREGIDGQCGASVDIACVPETEEEACTRATLGWSAHNNSSCRVGSVTQQARYEDLGPAGHVQYGVCRGEGGELISGDVGVNSTNCTMGNPDNTWISCPALENPETYNCMSDDSCGRWWWGEMGSDGRGESCDVVCDRNCANDGVGGATGCSGCTDGDWGISNQTDFENTAPNILGGRQQPICQSYHEMTSNYSGVPTMQQTTGSSGNMCYWATYNENTGPRETKCSKSGWQHRRLCKCT